MRKFVDSHLHMADSEFGEGYGGIDECSLLFSCTARADEWERQIALSSGNDRIFPFYGIHPWYCDEFDSEGLRRIIGTWTRSGVGEIGLDPLHGDLRKQMPVFEEQLSIAEEFDRPVSIHMVKAEKETLDILREHKNLKIMIHSFYSPSYVKPFSGIGCYFSISPRSIGRSEEKDTMLVRSIPKDRLLVETDYPGCKTDIDAFIERLALLLSISTDELIGITSDNARRLIQ